MTTTAMKRPLQLLTGALLLVLANAALAQFVWIDAKGTKQFSDQPPPPNTPPSKILRAPARAAVAVDAPDASAPKAAPAAGAAPASLAEREADFRKRQKDKADADKKAAATAANQAQRQAACDGARARAAQLASGRRLRLTTGDHAVLDDNARAAQQAINTQALAECNQ